jgi:hypothetical protein
MRKLGSYQLHSMAGLGLEEKPFKGETNSEYDFLFHSGTPHGNSSPLLHTAPSNPYRDILNPLRLGAVDRI